MNLYAICLLILYSIQIVISSRILAIVPTPSYSHQIVFQPIWKELSLKGHEVVVMTTDPTHENINNLREINLNSTYNLTNKRNLTDYMNGKYGVMEQIKILITVMNDVVSYQLEHAEVQNIIHNQSEYFDLVIAEHLYPAMFAFSHRFNCPLIGILPLGLSNEGYANLGIPLHPAIDPNFSLPFFTRFTFVERITTFFINMFATLFHYYNINMQNDLSINYFGSKYPHLQEISNNIDMIFVNQNPVLGIPKLSVPAYIEFGSGIHIKPPKPLPIDLNTFLNDSKTGVIYFSLGSNVKSVSIPEQLKATILNTFGELPYKVLWKLEDESLTHSNIKVMKWVPQQDVLRHPNVKAFISQCGLQSLEEALYSHVPILCIPHFGDQLFNAKVVDELGIGKQLDKDTLTQENFKKAIFEIVNNTKYKSQAIKLAKLSRDQPMTGLEKVVWWTEYVLRNKGAKHLRSPMADLPFYQYYLLDIIACVLLILIIFIYLLIKINKFIINTIFKKKVKVE